MLVADSPQSAPLGHEVPDIENCAPLDDINSQFQASVDLPPYEVHVVKRETIREPVRSAEAEYHSELVYFSDGAIRELTRAMPNARWFGSINLDHVVSGTDALGTGPTGINRKIIEGLTNIGYSVEWLHHQGPHAQLPTDYESFKRMGHFLFGKSVGRSAHHQHALFNHLDRFSGVMYDTSKLLSTGDSRGAMTGEAVDALAPQYGRTVLYSDYIAACFEHRPELRDVPDLLRVLPREGRSLGRLVIGKIVEVVSTGNTSEITDYLGTLDLHPMNLLHEAAWIYPLMCGDAGKYAAAVPLDSVGARTLETGDLMSQQRAWEEEHKKRKGIRIINRDGTHLDLVREQQARLDRFHRLMDSAREHDFSISDISRAEMNEVIYGEDIQLLAA